MSGFDQLGRELELAADQGRTSLWSRRAAGAGGAAAIAVALATVGVIVVGALALLRHTPRVGHVAAGPTAQPAPAAQGAAWARLLVTCWPPAAGHGVLHAPVASDAAPDPRLVAALGVLRGPWTSADAAPAAPTRGCPNTSPLSPLQIIDVRYVRYVGPGIGGGQVFLAAGEFVLPKLPGVKAKPFEPRSIAMACLITIGTPLVTPACSTVTQVEHPLAAVLGMLVPPRIPSAVVRRVCAFPQLSAAADANCVKNVTDPRTPVPLNPTPVAAGVVHDGIATVDVYVRAGHGRYRFLTSVPVHNNVFAFVPGPRANGIMMLHFKDASGRPVTAAPLHTITGTSNSTVVGVGSTISPIGTAPSLANVANIPLVRPPGVTRYGHVTTRTKGRP
jgi:hypothetical protein